MAGKLVPLNEAAAALGISPDRLLELRQNNEISGYRDGASWKFKQEEIDRVKEVLADAPASLSSPSLNDTAAENDFDFALPAAEEEDELLLAPDFGEAKSSGPSASDIMGSDLPSLGASDSELSLSPLDEPLPKDKGYQGSDVMLASDTSLPSLGGSDALLGPGSPAPSTGLSGSKLHRHDEDDDDMVLGGPMDVDLTGSKTVIKAGSGLFGGSGPIALGGDNVLDAGPGASGIGGSSSLGIGDDEDVLGGSGSGSDIKPRPGDSGILLIDPADSGLSLDAPPALGGSSPRLSDETVDFDSGAEDDFLLKPLEEGGDEDSESGSQVIMLDTEGSFDGEQTSTLIADAIPSMPGGLDMDFGGGGMGGGMGLSTSANPAATIIPPGMIVVPKETPFSLLSIIGLTACTLVLAVGGLMMYDLVRNIWSWDSPYPFTSALMDSFLGK